MAATDEPNNIQLPAETPAPSNRNPWLEEMVVYYDTSDSEVEEVHEYLVSDEYDTDTSDAYSSEDEDTNMTSQENGTSQSDQEFIYGRNKYKWFKSAPPSLIRAPQNLSQHEPSINLTDDDDVRFISIWKRLIDDEILQQLLRWTNIRLAKARDAVSNQDEDLQELDQVELLSFIGALVYSAYLRANIETADHMFSDGIFSRGSLFKCIMSKNRFINLLKYIRFDSEVEKEANKKTSMFAGISNILKIFMNNCQNLYNPGQFVSVGKASIPFKDPPCLTLHSRRCDKRGFQIMYLCDAKTGFILNGFIYKEPMEEENKYSKHTREVLHLCRSLHGSNRNLTCDKCFTSIELIEALKENGLSCLGAVSKSMRELPPSFLPSRTRARRSTLFAFTDNITLASYVPRKNKAITVASSMHHDEDKSEITKCFISTINGLVKIDSRRRTFSCARYTRRGCLAIFYWILDVSLINTYTAFKVRYGEKFRSDKVVRTLAHCLVLEQLQRRVFDERLPAELREKIQMHLGADMPAPPGRELETRTCDTCPPSRKRKAFHHCDECQKHFCLECSKLVCDCEEDEEM